MKPIEFRRHDQRGAALSRSAKDPGRWQVTYFDLDGFSGDSTHDTAREAVRELTRGGYRAVRAGWLQQLTGTARFLAGVDMTYVVAWTNDLISRGDRDSHLVARRYRESGLEAARQEYARRSRRESES